MVKIYTILCDSRSAGWRLLNYVLFTRTKQHLFLVSVESEKHHHISGSSILPRFIRVKVSEARKAVIVNFDSIEAHEDYKFPVKYVIECSNEERREDWKESYDELESKLKDENWKNELPKKSSWKNLKNK